jgi:hypothetical protein
MARAHRYLSQWMGGALLMVGCVEPEAASDGRTRVGLASGTVEATANPSPTVGSDLSCASPVWWASDLVVLDSLEAGEFCGLANAVSGSVYLLSDRATELQCLCEVSGDLVVSGVQIDEVLLPVLSRVGGSVFAQNLPELGGLVLPALTELDGGLYLEALDELKEVHLEALPLMGGSLSVRDAMRLELLRLPELAQVGSLELEGLEMPHLEGLGSLALIEEGFGVVGLNQLVDLDGLGQVSSIGGDLRMLENTSLSLEVVEGFIERVGRENIGGEILIDGEDPD